MITGAIDLEMYYAKDTRTGEVFETDDFKVLYDVVLRNLKAEMRRCLYFDTNTVELHYGACIHTVTDKGDFCKYVSFRKVCSITAYAMDCNVRVYVTYQDRRYDL